MSFSSIFFRIIDPEETIEGIFPGDMLQSHCPELLADYLSRLHFPDPNATYTNWTRKPAPLTVIEFPLSEPGPVNEDAEMT